MSRKNNKSRKKKATMDKDTKQIVFSKLEEMGALDEYYQARDNATMQATVNGVIDYITRYIFPYHNAVLRLEICVTELVSFVSLITRLNELQAILDGKAGDLSKCLTDIIECNKRGEINRDLSGVITAVSLINTLLIQFTSDPTRHNQDALITELDYYKSDALHKLKSIRSDLPIIGRPLNKQGDIQKLILFEIKELRRLHGNSIKWAVIGREIVDKLASLGNRTQAQELAYKELKSRSDNQLAAYLRKLHNRGAM